MTQTETRPPIPTVSFREVLIGEYEAAQEKREREHCDPEALRYAKRCSTFLGLLQQKLGIDDWGLSARLHPVASDRHMVPSLIDDDGLEIALKCDSYGPRLGLRVWCPECKQAYVFGFDSAAECGAMVAEGRRCWDRNHEVADHD